MTRELKQAFQLLDEMPASTKLLGIGLSSKEIAVAEEQLGVNIPAEYAAFLSTYGHGGAGGLELYGLPTPEDAPRFVYPHLVLLNKEMRQAGLDPSILAFEISGNGEAYGLKLAKSGTPKVVVFRPGDIGEPDGLEVVSDSFSEHLIAEVTRVRSRLGLG